MPNILTTVDFQNQVRAWVRDNAARIHGVWPLKGGWEAWAQAEICSVINAAQPTSSVLREQAIYTDPLQRVDLLVNDGTKTTPSQVIAVEMKLESLENARAFVDGLRQDALKLETKRSTAYEKCTRVLLAIFFSPQADAKLAPLSNFHVEIVGGLGVGWLIY